MKIKKEQKIFIIPFRFSRSTTTRLLAPNVRLAGQSARLTIHSTDRPIDHIIIIVLSSISTDFMAMVNQKQSSIRSQGSSHLI